MGCDDKGGATPEGEAPDAGSADAGSADAGADAAAERDAAVVAPSERLRWWAPPVDPLGGAWPLVVEVQDAAGARDTRQTGLLEVEVTIHGAAQAVTIPLRRGLGSATLVLPAGAAVAVQGEAAPRLEGPARRVSGELSGAGLRWGAGEVIVVEGALVVPAGATLEIGAGAVVRLAAGVNVEVLGSVEALGTRARPILWAPLTSAPWGGVVQRGAGVWREVMLVGGGGDASRVFGHSGSQPVLFAGEGASVMLEEVVIQDGPGKALGAQGARLTLRGGLITRVDTGGELERTALDAAGTWFVDLPAVGAGPADDDNDGLYLKDALVEGGAVVPSTLRGCVFMYGLDDGIDHNGATLELEGLWIEGFAHEGLATSTGGRVVLRDSVVRGCEQGIEAGYGAPELIAEHVLLLENRVGARFGDSYTWETTGRLVVRGSVFVGNRERDVWDHLLSAGGPGPPGSVQVERSLLGSLEQASGAGNVQGAALLTPALLLAPESPGRGIAAEGLDPGLLTGR